MYALPTERSEFTGPESREKADGNGSQQRTASRIRRAVGEELSRLWHGSRGNQPSGK